MEHHDTEAGYHYLEVVQPSDGVINEAIDLGSVYQGWVGVGYLPYDISKHQVMSLFLLDAEFDPRVRILIGVLDSYIILYDEVERKPWKYVNVEGLKVVRQGTYTQLKLSMNSQWLQLTARHPTTKKKIHLISHLIPKYNWMFRRSRYLAVGTRGKLPMSIL